MNTYKHHALGDYIETIWTYGTCNSYSMELVCKVFLRTSIHLNIFFPSRESWSIAHQNPGIIVLIGESILSRWLK
jgi:hypothetical protein